MEYRLRDEKTFNFIHFFPADSKHECIERFRKQPNTRILNDDDQLCTTEYSRIVPLENGEVKCHIKLLEKLN